MVLLNADRLFKALQNIKKIMNMKDLHLDSSLSFARKTALELVGQLESLADAIQDDGDYQPVSSEVSAEAKYGDGWKYLLKVYYQQP